MASNSLQQLPLPLVPFILQELTFIEENHELKIRINIAQTRILQKRNEDQYGNLQVKEIEDELLKLSKEFSCLKDKIVNTELKKYQFIISEVQKSLDNGADLNVRLPCNCLSNCFKRSPNCMCPGVGAAMVFLKKNGVYCEHRVELIKKLHDTKHELVHYLVSGIFLLSMRVPLRVI